MPSSCHLPVMPDNAVLLLYPISASLLNDDQFQQRAPVAPPRRKKSFSEPVYESPEVSREQQPSPSTQTLA